LFGAVDVKNDVVEIGNGVIEIRHDDSWRGIMSKPDGPPIGPPLLMMLSC
jgi:hypothetical protein